eukprot:scaffold7395_cov417-Prasinococcus_capsulatus_cf.AAC.3
MEKPRASPPRSAAPSAGPPRAACSGGLRKGYQRQHARFGIVSMSSFDFEGRWRGVGRAPIRPLWQAGCPRLPMGRRTPSCSGMQLILQVCKSYLHLGKISAGCTPGEGSDCPSMGLRLCSHMQAVSMPLHSRSC